jgi:ATP-dependent DNA helicase RecG
MNENILYELLDGLEWKDLEFKESRTNVPESVYETVSAFLNTEGGHIILGVNDKREIVGLVDVDIIQGNFIGELQNPDRFGVPINFEEYLKIHEDKNVLVFHIPEAQRKDKPVYVKTKKKGRVAFIRKGGGDYTCNKTDLDRMINDAQQNRPDGRLLDLNPEHCFDADSIKWFRHRYEHKGGNRSLMHLSDNDFLTELGLLVEHKGQLLPTLASVLLLGTTARFRQLMPRPIVDCLRYGFAQDHANTGKRWDKRITCEYNIVQTWQAIVDWFNSLAETPFRIDKESGQRSDSPPDFIAFREAVINLLSHQDITDQTRWPVIEDFSDLTRFWNPGDAFASADKLLEPGAKEVRNPIIVRALRDIGFSEQSGWGLREVYRNWHELGRVPPELNNDKVEKAFELKLNRKILMSEQQILLQSQIGLHLTPEEAAAFANLCSAESAQMTTSALRAALGLNGYGTGKII